MFDVLAYKGKILEHVVLLKLICYTKLISLCSNDCFCVPCPSSFFLKYLSLPLHISILFLNEKRKTILLAF